MFALYCQECDEIIIREGTHRTRLATSHFADDEHRVEHFLFYMGYWHPDFKVCEIEGEVRNKIETFGLAGVLEQVPF